MTIRTPDDPERAQVWLDGVGTPTVTMDIYVPRGNKGDPGGFTLGALLGAANLNEIVTSGVYRQTSAANSTPLNNYPEASLGVLLVYEVTAGTHLEQEFRPHWFSPTVRHGRVFYRRQLVLGAWSAWQAFTSQRVDETAGRAIYTWDDKNFREQLVHGDTGWRTVPVTPVAGKVLGGNVRYRRRGEQVEMAFVDVALDTSANGFCEIVLAADVPVGFRPSSVTRNQQAIGLQNSALSQQWITNYGSIAWSHQFTSGAYSVARPSVNLVGNIHWTTDEVWPTVLPGTAFGTIPNT